MKVHDLFANSKPYPSFLFSFFMHPVKHRKYFFAFLWIKANSIINDRNKIISNIVSAAECSISEPFLTECLISMAGSNSSFLNLMAL